MKKTIAILLVLVIGMVGVWAATATADLTLTTTVLANDEIKLTSYEPYETDDYDFGTLGGTTGQGADEANDLSVDLSVWDNSSTETAQNVAYVHARSNRAAGFKVTATATALRMTEGAVDYYIGYKINAGDTTGIVAADSTVKDVGTVMTVAAPTGSGYSQDKAAISIIPAGKSIDHKQGAYSATVTFTVVAQ
jgi:hypothetical protein